jgi:prolyl-tRNA editing enzyme YbaK/EbsC (Cys-tRNA(Pro) deacylase)
LDWKAIRKQLGRKTKLATEEQVWKLTHCVPGAVPPFASLFTAISPSSVRCFMDPSLEVQGATINFNAGLRTASLGMATADYMMLEQPTLFVFSS